VVGMILLTCVIAAPFTLGWPPLARGLRRLPLAFGALSLVLGVAVAYRIVALDGILAEAPRWTPQ